MVRVFFFCFLLVLRVIEILPCCLPSPHIIIFSLASPVIVVNQTPDTLQSLTLELATLGDLKLTEKPTSHTLGPHDFCNIKANVKVSSTETGIIFGNLVYDVSGAVSDRNCVILNDIHIDIMDYITPAYCSEVDFRAMWAEFEWENKVSVRTNISTLRGYLDHLLHNTNMKCLTPESALEGDCDYLAANLYARSVFGEDALANLSVEKTPDGSVCPSLLLLLPPLPLPFLLSVCPFFLCSASFVDLLLADDVFSAQIALLSLWFASRLPAISAFDPRHRALLCRLATKLRCIRRMSCSLRITSHLQIKLRKSTK